MPIVPPRPTRRKDVSVSPTRESYARSPLNENPPVSMKPNKVYSQSNLSASNILPRAPSVEHLPSIGQEGLEYANLSAMNSSEDVSEVPHQTSNVAGDLPLHAPKASVPSSTAQSRISGVTRTDSHAAAAAGIGKAEEEDDERFRSASHPLKSATSFNRSSSSLPHDRPGSGRPPSAYHDDEEHGIPEIGRQVPMYPNAGDVQAPTPQPYSGGQSTGIGFFNDSSAPGTRSQSSHGRRRSAQFSQPPGSYGLHGHGVVPQDHFERDWYAKHPDALQREEGEYGPSLHGPRNEWTLSSVELNKLVQGTGKSGAGMAASPNVLSVPNEEIGYRASEEYASRTTSPLPPSSSFHRPRTSGSQTYAESPLRETSFPINDAGRRKSSRTSDSAVDTDDETVHVDPPSHPGSKIHGGGYDPPTEDLGPQGGNTEERGGWIVEKGEGVPILASDEVAKNPEAEYMQPAVSPELERVGSNYAGVDSDGHLHHQGGWRSSSRPTSRPSSRPSSVHGAPPSLSRFVTHEDYEGGGTPLEEIEEYEPLFPEDEKDDKKRPMTQADKLKRPDLARHHFPSRDIWEDTPSSLQLETTVKSPQLPEEKPVATEAKPSKLFEPPEREQSRKGEAGAEDRANFLPDRTREFAKSHFKHDVLEDVSSAGERPGLQHRFPSQDIWEDSPSSLHLQTTVQSPQVKDDVVSPSDTKPTEPEKVKPVVPGRPARSKAGAAVAAEKAEQKDVSPVERKPPSIPDRPKPAVPARPAKHTVKADEVAADTAPLAKTTSIGSDTSTSSAAVPEKVNVAKIKPAPPARPAGGSKIAALKAGFMSDLQNKLSLGPQQVKKQEEEEEAAAKEVEEKEKQPLSDARKGRARGPQRRKPASSPAAAAATVDTTDTKPVHTLTAISTIWSIDDDDGSLAVPAPAAATAEALEPTISKSQHHVAPSVQDPLVSEPVSDQPPPRSEASEPLASHATTTADVIPAVTDASSLVREVEAADAPAVPEQRQHTVASTLEGEDEPLANEVLQEREQAQEQRRESKDETTQTGQTEMEVSRSESEGGGVEKLTAFVGGGAQDEGTVVVGGGEASKEGKVEEA
ncbi:MAG: hypothetical protein M1822_008907 [Bathelium mastoideum]|nr:MAG: hypothetical protein M1822_008907 [Bathelium mastoideum]